ncbi:sigma 54-interacting transcriptional regulator [Duganella violaceipulchra]|uniref:Sigma 54-interacting transcriptional regulator n=1 Tax=Duganella violaceipulchra TaxID=2849652 RepID=A0AA41H9V1_9BURK|nr:sigma 54-interacting transcriptional regulator [Duganella violaceicalia]MBV6320927.1 sigma 54-interacting transcriptional regulator [Duganella violaceicalia]MCP2008361.1 two-component system nitrogen regulation response regulator GlnG [Duganella violaceicalia]
MLTSSLSLEPAVTVFDPEYTLTSHSAAPGQARGRLLALTILWHPERERAGEQHVLAPGNAELELNRFAPLFAAAGSAATPLGHRCIARDSLRLRRDADDQLHIAMPLSRMSVELNGALLTADARLTPQQLDDGAILLLGGMVLLCAHWMDSLPRANSIPTLLGVSSAAIKVRELIRQVAATDVPVLLLGATGSGKEVVARAIHHASARRAAPLVSVNMATLSDTLAAADLFGAEKGAYTGAQASRPGWFAEAGEGTLFLDEIGNAPAAIQPMLLRVLECGAYRPLGARSDAQARARLIAATDQDLEWGGFNQPLLRRLEGFVIRLPPLRERRADIGLLILHFLRDWEARAGGQAQLPAAFVGALCRYDWPGNVRQLASAVQRTLIALQAGEAPSFEALRLPAEGSRVAPSAGAPTAAIEPTAPAAPTTVPPAGRTRLSDLSGQAVIAAMEQHGWCIRAAALALGVSRPSMYKLIDAHPAIRSLAAIPPREIDAALDQHGPDPVRCAAALRTPSEPLRRYLRERRGAPG